MMWVFLALIPIILCENRFLTTRQRKEHHGPVQINLKKEDNILKKDNVLNRHTRSLEDDHRTDYSSQIQLNRTVLNNDKHNIAFVEWGGTDKNSETIIVLTRDSANPPSDSSLYVSTNYGKAFDPKNIKVGTRDMVGTYIYQSPTNHRKFMINDEGNKAVVVSTDEGKTWTPHTLDFTPSYVKHHPVIDGLTMVFDQTSKKLYFSRDFGTSWQPILKDRIVVDYYWCNSQFHSEGQNTIYLSTREDGDLLTVWKSNDFFNTNKQVIDSGVMEFLLVDDFYFTIKKSTHTNHGTNDKDLFISYDREDLVKAHFPTDGPNNPTNEFYIADAGLGQVFVAVSHRDNSTNLYVSENKGKNMMLSLERILFTNQASYDQIRWLSGVQPFADFQAIEGLPGVFIASQLDPGQVGHRKIYTVMTFNKGGTWQRVQPPQYDIDGQPLDCFMPNCTLQISLIFGTKYPYAKHTPLLSKYNAPGLILASGNIGHAHSTINDLFMSNDGGVEWFPVLRGQYNFQFADHGGIAVAASREPTKVIYYSHDEGRTWYNRSISDKNMMIYGLVTEPGEVTTVFNVYATYQDKMEWIIITIDFKAFLGSKCVQGRDFMQWSIRDELKNTECVLGTNKIWERKLPTAHCYIGTDYQRYTKNESCPCQATDFECDFLYTRAGAGDPCLLMEGIEDSWFIPADCSPGGTYNKSMGYIKIAGDQCTGGEEHIFSYTPVKCPDIGLNNFTISVLPEENVKSGDTVTLTANIAGYVDDVFFFWNIDGGGDGGRTVKGQGKEFQSIKHTFDYGTGTYVVSLTASNGKGPVVDMIKVEVDEDISHAGLQINVEPADPVIDEGLVFVVAKTNRSAPNIDIMRLNYEWFTGDGTTAAQKSFLPLLLYSYHTASTYQITCRVTNHISSLDLTTSVLVSNLVISSLSAIVVDTTSIQVLWHSPIQRDGLISSYTLKYRTSGSDWHQVSLPVNSTSYRVNNLDPATKYTFIVVTSSVSGAQSKDSNAVIKSTLPSNTLPAPTDVHITADGTDATVTWTASSSSPNSYIIQYWKSRVPNSPLSMSTKKDTTNIKLTDLAPGAVYTIRVAAAYDGAVYSYAPVQNVQIEGITPQSIRNFKGSPTNDSAILLYWDKPAQPVSGYKVYNGSNSGLLVTVEEEMAVIVGLRPYTLYSFYVTPYLSSRTGTQSNSISVTTAPGTPGPVQNARCYEKDQKAVISWDQPATPAGPIVKYYVKPVDFASDDMWTVQGSAARTVSVPDLQMYKEYKFQIIVQGPEKYSLPALVTCKMTTGVPGPPQDLYVKTADVTYLELLWRQPAIKDSTLSYEIQYGIVLAGKVGPMSVVNTTDLSATLQGLKPSTEYSITISAINSHGTGPKSPAIVESTLTPKIGSIEYEIKFSASEYNNRVGDEREFQNAFKEEVVSLTKVSRTRISGLGVTHSDIQDVRLTFWLAPRDTAAHTDSVSSEQAVSVLDTAVKDGKFVVGKLKALSGAIEQRATQVTNHHDVAEIVIPCICGILVVLLISGLLYYRNRYHQLKRRHRITSHYAAHGGGADDVNLIECAEEPEGISSNDLQSGSLSIARAGGDSPQQPSRVKNFFNRFNYQPVDQEDPDQELLDDDEEHLLPL